MSFWLAIGPPKNWEIGVENQVWAVSPANSKSWEKVTPGDTVFFYATAPIKGIVGSGTVARTAVEQHPFWPEERKAGSSLWPFRIHFGMVKVLPTKDWVTKKYSPDRAGIVFQRAFQPLSAERAKAWLSRLP